MSTERNSVAVRRSARRLLLATVGMFGFGFALVPFYDVFCDLTGLNGRTADGPVAENLQYQVDENRTVTVELIANVNQSLPWEFRPEVAKIQVHPGEAYTTRFFARNLSKADMIGHAVPSVAPGVAARNFHKTQCFCFTEQRFAAGEGRWMPVRFTIDPNLSNEIEVVTLSYTFFDTGNVASAKSELELLEPATHTD